ncbi:diguanylate cyclase domain-containing protein [Nitrospira sp. Kam-Ns4a]
MGEDVQDSSTGAWSRFGLLCFAEQYLKLMRRMDREAILFVVGVNGVPAEGPHGPSHEARLREAARLLRRTFRTSDVVARVAPDLFAVLLLDTHPLAADALRFRLEDRLAEWQAEHPEELALALTMVADRVRPNQEPAFEPLLARMVAALRSRQAAQRDPVAAAPPALAPAADPV